MSRVDQDRQSSMDDNLYPDPGANDYCEGVHSAGDHEDRVLNFACWATKDGCRNSDVAC